ncbi:FAD-dependent oxidoreductase [Chloroflexota bacterium]
MTDRSFPRLFELARIGNVKLRNRLVMLPMGTAYALDSGEVTEKTIDYYTERAKGGIGLITVGNISPVEPNVINQLTLGSDAMLLGHYELVESVHAHGAKIIAQLNYNGKQKYPTMIRPGEELVSSSDIPTVYFGETLPTPRPLTKDEIYLWFEKYANAARRAKQVGYDMVELHGAHGYFINQFISPATNKRTDEFGGSLENRMRFPLELIKKVSQAVGTDYPVGFRISAHEFVPEGITLKESPLIAQILESTGVAYISVTAGTYDSFHTMQCQMRDPEGWKEYIWEAIKKAVKVPIFIGGSLKHPDFCERLLEQGIADFIGLARPLLADQEWPNKAKEGRVEDIRLCISCNECLAGSRRRRLGGQARRCAVNPVSGREREFTDIKPAPVPKKVMVIGGGPGGMEAARIAALRGHKVTIYEREKELGGALLLAGKPQSKEKILWLRDYLITQLSKLGVAVKIDIEVTPEIVEEFKPDAVVIATGSEPIKPDIPGSNQRRVLNAWDILQDKVRPEKQKVAVVGGGMIGCEVAEYLLDSGNQITIIEQLSALASDMEISNRYRMLEAFEKNKDLVMLTGRQVLSINETGVQIINPDNGQEETVEADWIVIAVGVKPVDALVNALEGKIPELYSVGDCNEPRVILEAMYEGSLAGRQI